MFRTAVSSARGVSAAGGLCAVLSDLRPSLCHQKIFSPLAATTGSTGAAPHAAFADQSWSRQCLGVITRGYAASGMTSPSKLDDIVDLDKFEGLTTEQCSELWMEFHSKDDRGQAAAVLRAEDFERFSQRAAESPMFVMPLVKPGGAFFTLALQCQMPFVLFTSLEEFRSMGPQAPTHLHVTHYPELKDSKGIVLVRADVTSKSGDVTVSEARTLLALLHSYYLEPTGYLKVHTMNHSPADFNFEEVLQEVKAVDRAMAAEPASGSPPQPSPEGSSGGSTQPQ